MCQNHLVLFRQIDKYLENLLGKLEAGQIVLLPLFLKYSINISDKQQYQVAIWFPMTTKNRQQPNEHNNQYTSVDLLRRRHQAAKQTPRSNAKSNCKQYHRSICTETTNLQLALNASLTRGHTLTLCTETICRRLYYDLKQRDKMNLRLRLIRPNSNTVSAILF